jgi:hypothetical protein
LAIEKSDDVLLKQLRDVEDEMKACGWHFAHAVARYGARDEAPFFNSRISFDTDGDMPAGKVWRILLGQFASGGALNLRVSHGVWAGHLVYVRPAGKDAELIEGKLLTTLDLLSAAGLRSMVWAIRFDRSNDKQHACVVFGNDFLADVPEADVDEHHIHSDLVREVMVEWSNSQHVGQLVWQE